MEKGSLKTRKMSNSLKIVLIVAGTALTVGILMFVIARTTLRDSLLKIDREETLNVAKMAAKSIDGDVFEKVAASGYGEDYDVLHEQLSCFLKIFPIFFQAKLPSEKTAIFRNMIRRSQ